MLPPEPQVGAPTLGQWRMLAMSAKNEVGEDGVWLDPARAKGALSDIKLGRLMTAEQYAASVSGASDEEARTMAALYKAHDELQRERKQVDFDDLILKAVMVLREDAQARATWQTRFHHLLVDEYQDIEPAQELLIRLIAAPHDELFCVGDEDPDVVRVPAGERRAHHLPRRSLYPRVAARGAGCELSLPAERRGGLPHADRRQPSALPK